MIVYPNSFRLDKRKGTARGLVGLWGPGPPRSTTLFDYSGRGNHGTLTTMDPATDWVADPERGWVLDFDGVSDYVQCGTAGFSPSAGSVVVWVRPNSTNTAGSSDFIFGHYNAGNRIYLTQRNTDFWVRLGSSADTDTTANLTANVWQQLGLTWNAGDWVAYSNGVAISNSTYSGLSTLNTFVDWGDLSAFTTLEFAGRIADGRVYNRALSAAEFNHIYRTTLREPYGDLLLRPRRVFKAPAAPPVGAIMNQMQGANLGADLFDGALLV